MKNPFPKIKNTGFTLLETLIAITILVVAIVGPLTIASNSLNTAFYARDQVTAYYLAQEGIEYMRYLRDNNAINATVKNGGHWDENVTSCLDVLCGFDPNSVGTSAALPRCDSPSCAVGYDTDLNLYRQTAATETLSPTHFKRTITVNKITSDEDRVTVNVSWAVGNLKSPNNFQITEDIFNWEQ